MTASAPQPSPGSSAAWRRHPAVGPEGRHSTRRRPPSAPLHTQQQGSQSGVKRGESDWVRSFRFLLVSSNNSGILYFAFGQPLFPIRRNQTPVRLGRSRLGPIELQSRTDRGDMGLSPVAQRTNRQERQEGSVPYLQSGAASIETARTPATSDPKRVAVESAVLGPVISPRRGPIKDSETLPADS